MLNLLSNDSMASVMGKKKESNSFAKAGQKKKTRRLGHELVTQSMVNIACGPAWGV